MRKIFARILFIIGLIILIFPFVIRGISYFNQSTVIYEYKKDISNSSKEEIDHKKYKSNEYNKSLLDEKPKINIADKLEISNGSTYDFSNVGEIIGTITIPKINIYLPIYDGVNDDNLQKGVVHLENTSYPNGDSSTHSVIAGHSGLTKTKMLDDLEKLEIGDTFQINYLNEISSYEVIDKNIVLPTQTDTLQLIPNNTLVTLVTCTPKGINSHRLLVTARKIENTNIIEANRVIINTNLIYYIITILLICTAIICLVIIKLKKKKNV